MATYGVLGVGSIATAIVTGLCDGIDDPPRILLSPRNAERAAALADRFPTVAVAAGNRAVVEGSDVVVVCLRQRDADELGELPWRAEQLAVSAMAGVPLSRLTELVAPAAAGRAVPMPAVMRRAGVTAVHPPLDRALELFDRLGETVPIESNDAFEAVFTASGTVAPFFEYLSTLAAFMTRHGVPAEQARRLVAENFVGVVAPLAGGSVPDFADLVHEYAPAGGGNDQLMGLLDAADVFDATREALDEVHRRLANP